MPVGLLDNGTGYPLNVIEVYVYQCWDNGNL